jgi:hypothetical protein
VNVERTAERPQWRYHRRAKTTSNTRSDGKHMASEKNDTRQPDSGGKGEAAELARGMVRRAWKGSLGTLSRHGGFPYTSLVAMATESDGAPLLLLSGLAEHTKNVEADQRASILIDGTSADRAALTGARVTLVGRLQRTGSANARARYLTRHPDAEGFIDFGDFGLFSLDIEWAHLVAGFGRIVRLARDDVIVACADARDLIEAEAGIIEHMNADHSDALQAIAAVRVDQAGGGAELSSTGKVGGAPWRMIGCDPEGVDVTDGTTALRMSFSHRIRTAEQVRAELVAMVKAARSGSIS